MTNKGILVQGQATRVWIRRTCMTGIKNKEIVSYFLSDVRLLTPKEHEGWQSALNFKDVDAVIKKLRTQCVVEVKTAPSISFGGNVQSIIAFRVTGLQAGYTDDLTKTF